MLFFGLKIPYLPHFTQSENFRRKIRAPLLLHVYCTLFSLKKLEKQQVNIEKVVSQTD